MLITQILTLSRALKGLIISTAISTVKAFFLRLLFGHLPCDACECPYVGFGAGADLGAEGSGVWGLGFRVYKPQTLNSPLHTRDSVLGLRV